MGAIESMPFQNHFLAANTGLHPVLGISEHAEFAIDLARLLATRLLVQASSGGGKSWCLRRILEQTHGFVHQIVIDPEGELESLADKFDYIVCSPDSSEAPLNASSGASVADAIYRSRRSVILSLGEFDREEMQTFVADFLKQLLRMPKDLWHHLIVAVDEAQIFAPQHDKSESKKPMIDLAGRGRKRGMCLIGATQRLALLNKSVAGLLENKLIGLTTLDADIARASDQLGMRITAARDKLRMMDPGEFVAYGPGLSYTPTQVRVGPVTTRHGVLGIFDKNAHFPLVTREALLAQIQSTAPAPEQPHAEAEPEEHRLEEYPRYMAIQPLLGGRRDVIAVQARAFELGVGVSSMYRWLQLFDPRIGPSSVSGRSSPKLLNRLREIRARTNTKSKSIDPQPTQIRQSRHPKCRHHLADLANSTSHY